MKFIISKTVFLDELQKLVGPTTSKQALADLLLISTNNNKIKMITTDLDITLISSKEAKIIKEGKSVVSMKRILSIFRELPDSEIDVELDKNNLLISCEQIEFKINTVNPEQFPKIEEKKHTSLIKLNPQDLEEMIRLTSFCVGSGEANYVLGGVLFELFGNEIKVVATDGKRLAFSSKKLPASQTEIKTKISFILPSRAVSEIYKLIKERTDDVFLFVEENRVGFDFKDTQFIARPVEGEFPNYSQYIPAEGKDKLIVDKKEFLLALRRAALLATSDYQGVKIELKKENMVVSKQTPQMGEVKESVKAKYNGAALAVGINPNFLIDVLKNVDESEVTIEFFGADKPAVLRKQGYVYLVLPMKI
jgi:DNA polymerase-3 subunit beta